jgi:hypothetical protein
VTTAKRRAHLASALALVVGGWLASCHRELRFDDLSTCAQDEDCGLPSLHCNAGRCVECVLDAHCPKATAPRCDPLPGRCVECGLTSDCTGGRVCKSGRCWQPCSAGCPASASRCDDGACVQCDDGLGCGAANGTPICVGHACGACASDADCGGATPACDPVSRACVQCQRNANCVAAAAPICDVGAGRCVALP